jgi:bifunctional UDP-N-acetylglucosamine pyrophosphorylase / glucosamine-1-phosphate N-acetyltransferase
MYRRNSMMVHSDFAAIILAAGEGTRLNSALPKVLHEIAGQPMIRHVVDALQPLEPAATIVVIGRGMETVARAVAPAEIVVQDPPRGTGDAVRAAGPALAERLAEGGIDDLLLLFGDAPLLRTEAIAALLEARRRAPAAAVAVAGMRPADPGPYGRVVVGADGGVLRIVEARDAGPEERKIGLCNGGIMAIDSRHALALLDRIGNDNAKREYYLTDIAPSPAIGTCCAGSSSCRRRRCWGSIPVPNWRRPRR